MSAFFAILLQNLARQRWRQFTNRLREGAKVTILVDFRFRKSTQKNYENRSKPSVAGREELKRTAECKCVDWTQTARDGILWKVLIITAMNLLTWFKKKSWWYLNRNSYVDKKNELDVTFCILYFSSNSFSTCFGQPCAHHQEMTTAWCYSLVLVCAVAAVRLSSPVGR